MMTAITPKGATAWMVLVWMPVLLAALSTCAIPSAQAVDAHVEGAMIAPIKEELAAHTEEVTVMCPGAAEDTLKTCMARVQTQLLNG